MEDLACLFHSQVGVAGAGGPAGKVVLGAGVRAHDLQDLAAGQLRHGLLGFEQRQRTGVSATVQGPVGGEFSHVLHSLTWWLVIIVAARQPVFSRKKLSAKTSGAPPYYGSFPPFLNGGKGGLK